jgi:hypothetical protein
MASLRSSSATGGTGAPSSAALMKARKNSSRSLCSSAISFPRADCTSNQGHHYPAASFEGNEETARRGFGRLRGDWDRQQLKFEEMLPGWLACVSDPDHRLGYLPTVTLLHRIRRLIFIPQHSCTICLHPLQRTVIAGRNAWIKREPRSRDGCKNCLVLPSQNRSKDPLPETLPVKTTKGMRCAAELGPSQHLLIRLFQQTTRGSVIGVPRPPFSKTLREFQAKFATEEACQQCLASCRWPDGFVCPRCGNRRAYELVKLRRWQCSDFRHQVSLPAGTILHNTRTPLTIWFWAAYLMTTDKRGISALRSRNIP